jgi:hypothetical protein
VPLEHGFQFFTESRKYSGYLQVALLSSPKNSKKYPFSLSRFIFSVKIFKNGSKNTVGDEELAKSARAN